VCFFVLQIVSEFQYDFEVQFNLVAAIRIKFRFSSLSLVYWVKVLVQFSNEVQVQFSSFVMPN